MTIRAKRNNGMYYKPNMTNLRGKLGREIMQTIRESPRPSREETRRKTALAIENIKKQMMLVELKHEGTSSSK